MAQEYLGTAIEYPLRVLLGAPVLVSGKEVIHQSIIQILATPVGSRFMLPEYGSRLHELSFEPNDAVLKNLLKIYTMDALSKWEKRAKFLEVQFSSFTDIVWMKIFGRILPSNEINSFVYPFYRRLVY